MDPTNNPFAPGAGSPPPELAGRHEIVNEARIALARIQKGRPTRSQILTGLRGVGKTVLLNEIRVIASASGLHPIMIEAHEGKTLPSLLIPALRSALYELSRIEAAKQYARQGLRVLKSFISAIKIQTGDYEWSISIDAEEGTADSGDIEADLPELFRIVAVAAQSANTALILIVDELQYLSQEEFSALIMSAHKANQLQLPFLVIAAGLPQILGLAGNSKSYAERLFQFPEVGALTKKDARTAIEEPVKDENAAITTDAIAEIIRVTDGYPYFLQQWGYEAWNKASDNEIRLSDVNDATPSAIEELDRSFFKVRFDRCTPSEKRYMRALAEFGEGTHRSSEVADLLGVKSQSVAPTRSSLIKKGMLYSPAHGDTAFTVPLFDQFMKRAMPELEKIL